MKKTYLSFLVILFSISFYGQTQIDEFVSVSIPGNVTKVDTIVKSLRSLNFVSTIGNETFLVLKANLDSEGDGLMKIKLPSDEEGLRKIYLGIIKGYSKKMKVNDQFLVNTSEFKIDNYICYRVICENTINEIQKKNESVFIILNESMYLLAYFNHGTFDEKSKSDFLNSVKIDSSLNPSQILGNKAE